MPRVINGCRRAIVNPSAGTPPSFIYISDNILDAAYARFTRSIRHGTRHGSNVPGPLESRRRLGKRNMAIAMHGGGSEHISGWSIFEGLFAKARPMTPTWSWSAPTLRAVALPDTPMMTPTRAPFDLPLAGNVQDEDAGLETALQRVDVAASFEAIKTVCSAALPLSKPARRHLSNAVRLRLSHIAASHVAPDNFLHEERLEDLWEFLDSPLADSFAHAIRESMSFLSDFMLGTRGLEPLFEVLQRRIENDQLTPHEVQTILKAASSLFGTKIRGLDSMIARLTLTITSDSKLQHDTQAPALNRSLARLIRDLKPSRTTFHLFDRILAISSHDHRRRMVPLIREHLNAVTCASNTVIPPICHDSDYHAFFHRLPENGDMADYWLQVMRQVLMQCAPGHSACDGQDSIFSLLAMTKPRRYSIPLLSTLAPHRVANLVTKHWLPSESRGVQCFESKHGTNAMLHAIKSAKGHQPQLDIEVMQDTMDVMLAMKISPNIAYAAFHAMAHDHCADFPPRAAVSLINYLVDSGRVLHAQRVFDAVPTLFLEDCPSLLDAMLRQSRPTRLCALGAFLNRAIGPTRHDIDHRLSLIATAAGRLAASSHLTDRQVCRRLDTLRRWYKANKLPLTPEFTRALVAAGITRYLRSGRHLSTMRVCHLLPLVRESEGADVADGIDQLAYTWRRELQCKLKIRQLEADSLSM